MAPMHPAHWWALAQVLNRDQAPCVPIPTQDGHFRLGLITGDLLCLAECQREEEFDTIADVERAAAAHNVRLVTDAAPCPPPGP